MAKNIYVGVGGKARKVKQLYVGVAGKARKVKKAYVGVGGKARLVYQSYVAVKGIDISYEILSRYTLVVHATVTPGNATDRRICYTSSANNSDDDWYMNKAITFTFDLDANAGTATATIEYNYHMLANKPSGCLTLVVDRHPETKKAVRFKCGFANGFIVDSVT